MTTGRINQVTTVRNAQRRLNTKLLAPFHRCFRSAGVRTKGVQPIDIGKAVTAGLPSTQGRTSKSHHPPSNHLVPRSHKFQAHFLPVLKGTEIMAFREDYQQPAAPERHAQSRRIPEWLFDRQVWPSASNPHPPFNAGSHNKRKEPDCNRPRRPQKAFQRSCNLSQVSPSRLTGASMTRSMGNQPSMAKIGGLLNKRP
jgi:hypothetical protein